MHPIASTVNSVITVMDVDGVVRKINVDEVVKRIDVNHVVSRIDLNDAVSRIDLNQALSTIDFDALLQRVDVNAVLNRVDTKVLVAKSSTGVFTSFLDTLRTQVVLMDLYLWILARCRVWCQRTRQKCYLPPRPGRHLQRHDKTLYPKGRSNKAIAVQGRYCGFISKAIAVLMDILTITLLFALLFQLIEWCLVLFLGRTRQDANQSTQNYREIQQGNLMAIGIYCIYWFLYFFLCVGLTGQTVGMLIVGLKVCSCTKQSNPYAPVSMKQAFVRTCLLPLTLTLCPPLGIMGLWRRDGRMLHDWMAGTGMIYLWNAKLAKVRRRMEHSSSTSSSQQSEDDYDDLDDMIVHDDQSDGEGVEVQMESDEDDFVSLGGGDHDYSTFSTSSHSTAQTHQGQSNRTQQHGQRNHELRERLMA